MGKKLHVCRECLTPLEAGHKASRAFCSDTCKAKWNNRRKSRGADIYDLWMAMRYERDEAKRLGVWKEMCRLSERWHDEDEASGVKSYDRPEIVLNRLKDSGKLMRARPFWDGIVRR